jgi:hypothetical protein
MHIEQRKWSHAQGWAPKLSSPSLDKAQLVLLFGETSVLTESRLINPLRKLYPAAHFMGCSTAGEICGTHLSDNSLVATAAHFEHSQLREARVRLDDVADSAAAGEKLAQALPHSVVATTNGGSEKLAHVFVLSDGLKVNGSDLLQGLTQHLPEGVPLTGGLAGDGTRFDHTLVICDGEARSNTIAVLGLYGSRLKIGVGSLGGWDSFGPERLVTRSRGNVLQELDGQSALSVYKKHLGNHARGLPSTGLLFPLSLRTQAGETAVVRSIISIDEKEQTMTLAGNVPEGSYARLMKADFDRLIDGAAGAARTSHEAIGSGNADLAILISCVGRKLVLRQRVEEELEGVRDVLGQHTTLAGFYSYGEISPFSRGARCELHNQTMTVTTISED